MCLSIVFVSNCPYTYALKIKREYGYNTKLIMLVHLTIFKWGGIGFFFEYL